jgi:hypothetical protein
MPTALLDPCYQSTGAAKRTLDASKRCRTIHPPERRLDQPRMSFFTNRPTFGAFRNSPGRFVPDDTEPVSG